MNAVFSINASWALLIPVGTRYCVFCSFMFFRRASVPRREVGWFGVLHLGLGAGWGAGDGKECLLAQRLSCCPQHSPCVGYARCFSSSYTLEGGLGEEEGLRLPPCNPPGWIRELQPAGPLHGQGSQEAGRRHACGVGFEHADSQDLTKEALDRRGCLRSCSGHGRAEPLPNFPTFGIHSCGTARARHTSRALSHSVASERLQTWEQFLCLVATAPRVNHD